MSEFLDVVRWLWVIWLLALMISGFVGSFRGGVGPFELIPKLWRGDIKP